MPRKGACRRRACGTVLSGSRMRLLFAIVAVGALARRQLCWQSPPPHPPAPRYTQHFTRFAPKLDIVWSRGWYNAFAPAGRIPLEYYNERGLDRRGWSVRLPTLLNSSECCGLVWLRTEDVGWFADAIVPELRCEVALVSSDGDQDVPAYLPPQRRNMILGSPWVTTWYAQNAVRGWRSSPKLMGIPIGLGVHDGVPGSPDSMDTMRQMFGVRAALPPFRSRKRTILMDLGTFTHGGKERRDRYRQAVWQALRPGRCTGVTQMPHVNKTECWRQFGAHQFAIAPTGMGWDTHRLWELLFLGTVPIVQSGPLDPLLAEAHLPVIIVRSWSDLCEWTPARYAQLVRRYEHWIAGVHAWLNPKLWVPRDQRRFDELCDAAPGCRDGSVYAYSALWPSTWLDS